MLTHPPRVLFPHAASQFPVYAVLGFGFYSLLQIIYNVATFNDCKDAAAELDEVSRMRPPGTRGALHSLRRGSNTTPARVTGGEGGQGRPAKEGL
mmetsp:Transcript_14747/g.44391  ORF Transcript_14747/g.44391 Transcript_14747/m.44391 type:complete len:95 (-) Transcript_14747:101-385(-)